MITRIDFAAIDAEIRSAIDDALTNIRSSNHGDYALLLADGDYRKEYEKTKLNPYVIDNRIDRYQDETRLTFLTEFLTTFYSFPAAQLATDDNHQRIHMELMIYTHIWEAQPFLKKLYCLALLNNIEQYDWRPSIPPMSKHKFIREVIKAKFTEAGHPLENIITNGFHTSLRNAFAHSQYSFDTMNGNRRIWLDNYNGDDSWEIREISFDDWSRRFVYSALLSYYLLRLSHEHRVTLVDNLGYDEIQIKHRSKADKIQFVWIKYDPERDSFSFLQ